MAKSKDFLSCTNPVQDISAILKEKKYGKNVGRQN